MSINCFNLELEDRICGNCIAGQNQQLVRMLRIILFVTLT